MNIKKYSNCYKFTLDKIEKQFLNQKLNFIPIVNDSHDHILIHNDTINKIQQKHNLNLLNFNLWNLINNENSIFYSFYKNDYNVYFINKHKNKINLFLMLVIKIGTNEYSIASFYEITITKAKRIKGNSNVQVIENNLNI